MLILLWLFNRLSHPLLVGGCWLLGICLQFVLGTPPNLTWLSGLLINAALGVLLAIRVRLD
jgi:hypothetical protein